MRKMMEANHHDRKKLEKIWKQIEDDQSRARAVAGALVVHAALARAQAILAGAYRRMISAGRPAAAAPPGPAAMSVSRADLNLIQLQNLQRFEKKLPTGASKSEIYGLEGGGKGFRAEVPGKVPGSKAIYEKQVDATGRTIAYTKTTIAPDGKVMHIKDKFKK